jgi:diadenosine tetraphosphate (Ap4A) HIT family hydrolase
VNFVLDPKLESDTDFVCQLPLSQVRLHKNAAFPWLILIPERKSLVELIDLSETDQLQLWQEITQVSKVLKTLFNPTKLNVANLGNVVPQLHVHIIVRFDTDDAWPNPVWNSGVEASYDAEEKQERIEQLAMELRK